MGLQWIRDTYAVPAKRGGRIRFAGNIGKAPLEGVIVGARNQYLRVRWDGGWKIATLHPTWEVTYL